ncbi:helix-turn-helix domain-containing protein [Streptomyces scopuliridis]
MDSNEARLKSGLVTVPEIAAELRVSKAGVYRLIETGELPAGRVGRAYRITEADFSAYKKRAGLTKEE